VAVKIERNLLASRKVDLFGSTRASSSNIEAKLRAMNSNDLAPDAITKLAENMDKVLLAVTELGNQLVRVERLQQC
jgi:hypothetical protein